MGLKDAKDFVEGPPRSIIKNVSREEAEYLKYRFEKAGAKVEIK